MFVILHVFSYSRSEVSWFEGIHHFFNQALHLAELINHIVAFCLATLNLVPQVIRLLFHRLDLLLEFCFVQFWHRVVTFDLIINLGIAFFESITLLVELIDIVEQAVVLFFCFNESSNNFIDVGDARSLLDHIEGLSNYTSVSNIQVQHAFLLFVFVFNVFESYLQNLNRVKELLWLFPIFSRHFVFSFVVFHLAVSLFKFFLQFFYF